MMASKLQDIMEDCGVRYRIGHVADSDYDLPSAKWFSKTFPKALLKFWRKNKLVKYDFRGRRYIFKWTLGVMDCDNAAAMAFSLAGVLNFKERKKNPLAVGEFWYVRGDGRGAHAINCALIQGRRLIFLEPQTCRQVKLSVEEIQSCYFYRF